MRPARLALAAVVAVLILAPAAAAGPTARRVVLAVHGGTGSDLVTKQTEAGYRRALTRALRAGARRLRTGASSVDAVQAAVEVLEDDPRFNAGRGAVFNTDGHIELDAAIMDGRDRDAGAVAGIRNTKNPIAAARAVKDRSPHVLLGGEGADRFARQIGLPYVTQDYFWTAASWRELRAEKRSAAKAATASERHGTVGAVARDASGHLAAATSTGGLTNKLVGASATRRWWAPAPTPTIAACPCRRPAPARPSSAPTRRPTSPTSCATAAEASPAPPASSS